MATGTINKPGVRLASTCGTAYIDYGLQYNQLMRIGSQSSDGTESLILITSDSGISLYDNHTNKTRGTMVWFFKPGDTWAIASCVCPGFITRDSKDIYINVRLPRIIASNVSSVTINTLTGCFRGNSGLLAGTASSGTNILTLSGATTTVDTLSNASGSLMIKTAFSSAVSGATNNTPVSFCGTASLTFNGT